MPLNFKDGKKMLTDTIQNGLRHQDYPRVCKIAKDYTAFVTGEDVKDLITKFSRETDEWYEQKVALTQVITDYMAYRLMNPMFKVPRTAVTKMLTWEKNEKAEENRKILETAMAAYAGDESLDDYLATALALMDSTDPNSFIITELPAQLVDPTKKDSKAEPYPFEVNSEEAINYKKKNNKLEFLVVLNKIKDMNRFTIYLENDAIVAQQISLDDWKTREPKAEILFKDPEKKEADEIYLITTAALKSRGIPAIQIGTRKDLKTRKRTFVPLIHPARAFFIKSIKTISEFDLTNALHVFPQKITYDSVCPGDVANQVICTDGKQPSGATCTRCNGSGFNEHKSAQDILRVPMPRSLSEVVSLENFIAYKHPPTEILDFLKKLGLYEFPDLAVKAVYSSELFTSDNITTTATEKNIDLESVYDTLKPYANKYSAIWKHIARVMAAYLNVDDGLTIDHVFPKDFKMKSLTMLLEDLSKASTSGVPSYIKKELNRDIAHKLYVDKPDEIMKLDVREKFFPFNGKTESEIGTVINNNLTSMYNKVLYANFDQIFDELDQENSNDVVSFYKIEITKQKELIKTKVQAYIDAIGTEQADSRVNDFGSTREIPEEEDLNPEGGGG